MIYGKVMTIDDEYGFGIEYELEGTIYFRICTLNPIRYVNSGYIVTIDSEGMFCNSFVDSELASHIDLDEYRSIKIVNVDNIECY